MTTPYLTLAMVFTIVIIVFERLHKSTGFVLPLFAAGLSAFVMIAAIIEGAKLSEVLIFAAFVFILFALGFFHERDGGDK
ncbi:MAG: hypothetical protein J6Z36_04210 [Clostridia bacterium]|nr:hypothetical protein [Clostridia bacterium]